MMAMLDRWLQRLEFKSIGRLTETRFQMHHGDLLNGGRGELFVVARD